MKDEYDFSKGERGRYAARYAEGSNIVLLDPDVAALFPTAASVNRALRALAEVAPVRPENSTDGGNQSP
ncbi:MAG: hypothetical protein V3W41_02300 [Planctomycetota bacterium]